VNTRAILFILGLVIGAIAVFLWKKGEIDRLRSGQKELKACTDDLKACADQLKEARALLSSTASVVIVGPTAGNLSDPQLQIHAGQQPVVYWKSLESGHPLAIDFDAKDYPTPVKGEPPFVSGTPGKPQSMRCDGDTCFSYGLNPKVAAVFSTPGPLPCPTPMPNHPSLEGKQCLDFKYSQTLDKTTVDGHIIIVSP
jgi:hypothetical protein